MGGASSKKKNKDGEVEEGKKRAIFFLSPAFSVIIHDVFTKSLLIIF